MGKLIHLMDYKVVWGFFAYFNISEIQMCYAITISQYVVLTVVMFFSRENIKNISIKTCCQ